MNWNTTMRELADRGELLRDRLVTAALANDTIYMPSDVAARTLGVIATPVDADARASRARALRGEGPRSLAH